MLRGRILLLLSLACVLCSAHPSAAQSQPRQNTPTRPVSVRVRLFDADIHRPVALQVSARLLDRYGSPVDDKFTDSSGTVQFRAVLPGSYQIEVVGQELAERVLVRFDIMDNEAMHTEIVPVHLSQQATRNTPGSAIVSATQLQIPDDAAKQYKKGTEALQHKNWADAKRYFQEAVKLYPQFDQAYNTMGVACEQSGDHDCSMHSFESAIRINQKNAEAHRNLARMLLASRKYADADHTLQSLLSFEPRDPWALTTAAYAEFELGHLDDALANAQKVHELPHEGFSNAHLIAARVYEAQQKLPEARNEYEQFLKESPNGSNADRARAALVRLAATKQP